eukprot:scaffold731_cov261-Pinguiococcus_pyrenoidosus.AAC.67
MLVQIFVEVRVRLHVEHVGPAVASDQQLQPREVQEVFVRLERRTLGRRKAELVGHPYRQLVANLSVKAHEIGHLCAFAQLLPLQGGFAMAADVRVGRHPPRRRRRTVHEGQQHLVLSAGQRREELVGELLQHLHAPLLVRHAETARGTERKRERDVPQLWLWPFPLLIVAIAPLCRRVHIMASLYV